jgi:uncharacterized protein (DUF1499 family)
MRTVARLALGLGIVAVLLLLVAGPGTRLGLWHFRTGFLVLRLGAYAGIAAAVLGLVALVRAPGRARAAGLAALLLGLVAFGVPLWWMRAARSVPPIHDITTDTERPPAFVAVLPLRADAANPAEYGGPEIARQQREAYPDIVPLTLPLPPDAALARARAAAEALGWSVVAVDGAAGRLEASDRTAWFGFVDDVVVRVEPAAEGSRVDVRSVSRVGKSDVGKNAARIREFLEKMREGEG